MLNVKKKEIESEIFTGSMADISFLLIIYFMVTSVFSATRGLDFALPDDSTTPPEIKQEESILVSVLPGDDLRIEVDGKEMPLEGLLPYCFEKLEQNADKPVILRTDPDGTYGNMITVFDELRKAKETWSDKVVTGEGNTEQVTWVPKYTDRAGKPLGEIAVISIPTRREIENIWSMLGVAQ
jgi:biopolymer transport protein ExbD